MAISIVCTLCGHARPWVKGTIRVPCPACHDRPPADDDTAEWVREPEPFDDPDVGEE